MLLKLIVLALAVYLVLQLLRQYGRNMNASGRPEANPPQDMVACATCGLHVPRSETLLAGGRYYCCAEHRDRDQQ
jgi:uncharacterized protein